MRKNRQTDKHGEDTRLVVVTFSCEVTQNAVFVSTIKLWRVSGVEVGFHTFLTSTTEKVFSPANKLHDMMAKTQGHAFTQISTPAVCCAFRERGRHPLARRMN